MTLQVKKVNIITEEWPENLTPTTVVSIAANGDLEYTPTSALAEAVGDNFVKKDPSPETSQTFLGDLMTRGTYTSFQISGAKTELKAQGIGFTETNGDFEGVLGGNFQLTADREWLLPDANGTVALEEYVDSEISPVKELAEDTAMMVPSSHEEEVPRDKSSESFPVVTTSTGFYGESDMFFIGNNLVSVNIYANATGNFSVRFCDEAMTVLHTYSGAITTTGLNVIPAENMGIPDLSYYNKIYVLLCNDGNTDPNVISYGSGGGLPLIDLYIMLADETFTVYNDVAFSLSAWLTVRVSENLIVDKVSELGQNINGLQYNYAANKPILPSQIFVLDDRPTPIYKNSLFERYQTFPGLNLLSNGKNIEMHNPTYINYENVSGTGRLIVDKQSNLNKLVYKDIEIIKASIADKIGSSVSVMNLGDSLTESGTGSPTASPTWLLVRALEYIGINVTTEGTIQRTEDGTTYRNEGRGGWRYRTFTGLESQYAGVNVVIPSPTKSVWIEGVDGSMDTIKSNNVFLYEATGDDKTDYPEWCFHFVSGSTVNNVSYAQNPSLGTYYIFDPARYLSERSKTAPDILTIALGTNEWYLQGFSGFDLELISNNAEWMITRFREAMPDTNIVVIPCNNFPLTLEAQWQEKAAVLTSEIIRICDVKRELGDDKLFTLSIFAHGDRTISYDDILTTADLSSNNDTKVSTVSRDVHMLNTDDEGRKEYMDALTTAVICLTENA